MKRKISKINKTLNIFFPKLNTKPTFSVLIYHSVNSDNELSISPKNFEDQIKYITSNYNVIDLEESFRILKGDKSLNEKNVMVTFDDGFSDNFIYAFPILHQNNCPATFFITTSFILRQKDITKSWSHYKGLKAMNSSQIETLSSSGMTIGAHTHTHPMLTKLTEKEVENEIVISKNILEKITKRNIDTFAFPFGNYFSFNKNIVEILKKNNFKLAFSTVWGINDYLSDPFLLKRIRVDPFDNLIDLQEKIEGNWNYINYIQLVRDNKFVRKIFK